MEELVPDWIKKRPYLWPLVGYVCLTSLIVPEIDSFPLTIGQRVVIRDLPMFFYVVGYGPVVAWCAWIYRKDKEKKARDRWRTPGSHNPG